MWGGWGSSPCYQIGDHVKGAVDYRPRDEIEAFDDEGHTPSNGIDINSYDAPLPNALLGGGSSLGWDNTDRYRGQRKTG